MGENLWAIVGKMKLVLYFLIYCLGEVESAKVQFLAERLTLTLSLSHHKSVCCLRLRLYGGTFVQFYAPLNSWGTPTFCDKHENKLIV